MMSSLVSAQLFYLFKKNDGLKHSRNKQKHPPPPPITTMMAAIMSEASSMEPNKLNKQLIIHCVVLHVVLLPPEMKHSDS